ncbi:AzlD domain-containing protein [Vallitalea okinawensis]|uniref:AzlD domain-containing protein n=1 Tax=Vallitalea okinawensis TaxID=2078660 RepID=UPI000CFBAF7C|nr:AzlD domain-containing protein [Vallitalea okinawensis]
MSSKIWIIIGMMVVTFLPRLLPFYVISKIKLSPRWRLFLTYIPYTSLGALIIPGVLQATPTLPIAGVLGLCFVCLYGWFKDGVIIPVVGSVIVAFIFMLGQA